MGNKHAFSLVEVVLALGIFSFAILAIVGLMATGISTVQNSSTNMAIANISRSLRASVQATPFTNWVSGGSPVSYTSTTNYYTVNGYPTTTPGNYFYTAALIPAAPVYPSGLTSTNACIVGAIIYYPYPVNTQVITNSLFVAQ
jgi:uncharacterized protein (TIGR02598 family)